LLPENIPPRTEENALFLLSQRIETHRADLIQHFEQDLRGNIFLNRIGLRPSDVGKLAEQEVDSLISSLRNAFVNTKQHGVELCQAGLSKQSVLGLIKIIQDFFTASLGNNDNTLVITAPYAYQLWFGFIEEREKMILEQQENIRIAFEMALAASHEKILAAQLLAKKVTESNYRNILDAQEEERRKISRELHDDAGQTLIGLRLSLENLKSELSDHPELKANLEKAASSTDNLMQSIRSLAYRLRPSVLDMLGLNMGIKQLCFDFSEQTHLRIDYNGTDTPTLSDELSINIYRILQEALANIFKHARAKRVWVRLHHHKNLLELTVKDNGHGFDPQTNEPGIGLESMRERTSMLNGKMEIKTELGKSTYLSFSFPVVSKTAHSEPEGLLAEQELDSNKVRKGASDGTPDN
jgi:signal transduction histidine kinase